MDIIYNTYKNVFIYGKYRQLELFKDYKELTKLELTNAVTDSKYVIIPFKDVNPNTIITYKCGKIFKEIIDGDKKVNDYKEFEKEHGVIEKNKELYIILLYDKKLLSTFLNKIMSKVKSLSNNPKSIIMLSSGVIKTQTRMNKLIVDTKSIKSIDMYDSRKIMGTIIPKRLLVPKHEILSLEESIKYFKTQRVVASNIPKIGIHDPQIIWLGAQMSQICKITRYSMISGISIYYRIVD